MRMRSNKTLVILLISVLLALPAQAVTVLDNTASYTGQVTNGNETVIPVSTYADTNFSNGFSAVGSSFTTGTSDLSLNSVTLLFDPESLIKTTDPSLVVSIVADTTATSYYENSTGTVTHTGPLSHPNTNVNIVTNAIQGGTVLTASPSNNFTTHPNPTLAGTPFTWVATGGLTLTASTTYWIVLTSTNANGYYSVDADTTLNKPLATFTTAGGWSVPTGTTSSTVDFAEFTTLGGTYGTNSVAVPAKSWLSLGNDPLFFSIDASVPEPSKALLTFLGMLSLGMRRTRRR